MLEKLLKAKKMDGGTQAERITAIMHGLNHDLCHLINLETTDKELLTIMVSHDPDDGNYIILAEDFQYLIDEDLIEWHSAQ